MFMSDRYSLYSFASSVLKTNRPLSVICVVILDSEMVQVICVVFVPIFLNTSLSTLPFIVSCDLSSFSSSLSDSRNSLAAMWTSNFSSRGICTGFTNRCKYFFNFNSRARSHLSSSGHISKTVPGSKPRVTASGNLSSASYSTLTLWNSLSWLPSKLPQSILT